MSIESENNKRIAKNTLLLYFRMLLSMIVSLYTSRVVLNALGVEDYGIYNVVGGVVTMFTFINSSMASATQRFLTFELGKGNKEELHKVFCTSIAIHALISLVIFILAETIGLWFLNMYMNIPDQRIYAAHWIYQMSVLSTIVLIMSVPYNATIIAHERMSAFAYISILEIFLKLGVVYFLLIFNVDKLILYAFMIFIVQFFIRIIYGKYCTKHFKECHYQFLFDRTLFKKMVTFAGWSMFGNLSAVAFTQGLNILLNIFFGSVVNAARAIAVQVQHAIQGFIGNFQMALNPQIVKNYACGNLEQMHTLIYASSRYSFFLLFALSFPIFLETKYILSIWLVIVPEHTVYFVRLILCTMMIDTLANPLITAANATGNIKVYQIIIGGILLLILPISYVILKLGGTPESVFIVHLIMVVIAQISRVIIIRPMIHLSLLTYFKEVVCKILLVLTVSIVLPYLIYNNLSKETFSAFLLVCISCVFFTTITIYHLGLNKSERDFIHQKIYRLKNKIFR